MTAKIYEYIGSGRYNRWYFHVNLNVIALRLLGYKKISASVLISTISSGQKTTTNKRNKGFIQKLNTLQRPKD